MMDEDEQKQEMAKMAKSPKTGLMSAMEDESQDDMETPGEDADEPMPEGGITEDEQQMYDLMVGEAKGIIFGKDTMGRIVQALKQISDPAESIAVTTANVMLRVLSGIKKRGGNIPIDIIYAAGQEVFADVAELATKAGIHDFGKDDQGFNTAFIRAVDRFRVKATESKLLDKAEVDEEMRKMIEADRAGKLNEMLGADVPSLDMSQIGAGQGAAPPEDMPPERTGVPQPQMMEG